MGTGIIVKPATHTPTLMADNVVLCVARLRPSRISLVRSTIAIDRRHSDDARLPLSPVAVLLCSMPAAGLDIHSLPFVGLLQQISVVLTAAVMPLASGHSHGHATAAASAVRQSALSSSHP